MVTEDQQQQYMWTMPLCCNCCSHCSVDPPLCCYAFWCPMCIWGEIMEKLDQGACCCCPNNHTCCSNCCCYYLCAAFLEAPLQTAVRVFVPFVGDLIAPFFRISPIITRASRNSLGEQYGLPTNECSNSCCAHYWCEVCSLYQEATFLKQQKGDFTCCCYTCCCVKCCCKPKDPQPPASGGAATSTTVVHVVSAQPAAQNGTPNENATEVENNVV